MDSANTPLHPSYTSGLKPSCYFIYLSIYRKSSNLSLLFVYYLFYFLLIVHFKLAITVVGRKKTPTSLYLITRNIHNSTCYNTCLDTSLYLRP